MKFSFFHLMPYTHLDLESHDWPFPNRYFDPAKASALYRTYVESMIHAEGCGFDWVGCNEHHFQPLRHDGQLQSHQRRARLPHWGTLAVNPG